MEKLSIEQIKIDLIWYNIPIKHTFSLANPKNIDMIYTSPPCTNFCKVKTKIEIIDEIVKYYSEDTTRRSIEKRNESLNIISCYYNNSKGNFCAFAYVVKEEFRKKLVEFKSPRYNIEAFGDEIFKQEFKFYSKDYEFWNDIQLIHDKENNWCINSLSELGIKFVDKVKEKHKN